jgi:hypothetical protein
MATSKLPVETVQKIFENLSFEDTKEFGDEKYWRRRLTSQYGVRSKSPGKLWKDTFELHDNENDWRHRLDDQYGVKRKIMGKSWRFTYKIHDGLKRDFKDTLNFIWAKYIFDNKRPKRKLKRLIVLASQQKNSLYYLTKIFRRIRPYEFYILLPLLRKAGTLSASYLMDTLISDKGKITNPIGYWVMSNEELFKEFIFILDLIIFLESHQMPIIKDFPSVTEKYKFKPKKDVTKEEIVTRNKLNF